MTTQDKLAVNLYRLLEDYYDNKIDDPHIIIDAINQINDINRWNILLNDYQNYDIDISVFIIDIYNPLITVDGITGRRNPINYGESILTFFTYLFKHDLDAYMYPMADEIVEALILKGAKSSLKLYNNWLEMEDDYQYVDWNTYEMYENIIYYLGLFKNINPLQNLAFASSMIPHSNDTPLRHLDYDTLGKIMSRSRPYDDKVQTRMMLEQQEKEKEENDRIADFVDYLNTIEQYGMGKHGKKRSGKKKSKTKKKK